jgi:hypothetical protein
MDEWQWLTRHGMKCSGKSGLRQRGYLRGPCDRHSRVVLTIPQPFVIPAPAPAQQGCTKRESIRNLNNVLLYEKTLDARLNHAGMTITLKFVIPASS